MRAPDGNKVIIKHDSDGRYVYFSVYRGAQHDIAELIEGLERLAAAVRRISRSVVVIVSAADNYRFLPQAAAQNAPVYACIGRGDSRNLRVAARMSAGEEAS
jgi:hypothetical protein